MGQVIHASCIAVDGRGLLILGPSGSGKSSLALALIGLGAELVADDQTELHRQEARLLATCPPALRGLVEARGIGLLNAPSCHSAEVAYAVDLQAEETERLPPHRTCDLLGVTLPLVLARRTDHLPFVLIHLLRHGRRE